MGRLRHLQQKVVDTIKQLALLKREQGEAIGVVEKAAVGRAIVSREIILNSYKVELRNYGGGQIQIVTGQYWAHISSDVKERRNFKWGVAAESIEEAKEVFESQVFHLLAFIPETISYQTFSLKTIINT